MVEGTLTKGLENSIAEINKTLQQFLEDSDRRHSEYTQHRLMDQARLERVENQLSSLHSTPHPGNKGSVVPPPPQQPFQTRNIKLDFPRSTEQSRRTHGKDVVPWFQMISRNHPFQSWAMFTRALEMEFGPTPYESPRLALFKLTQTSTGADFYSVFTVLANRPQ
ncbi:hypothetical protein KIW84_061711 [Lathyrus oleraceus]|uniref:Retrotransposon gag domain-containing protein n=1 Tax=Pisum sativum TaxID=3888 RepID=A0A9D5A2P2_PEA|nr:hypothetical protein KIW84_061711 [Pisum sativum]